MPESEQFQVKQHFNFSMISNVIIDDERVDKNDLLIYIALSRYANNNTGECFPSIKTLSAKARLSTRAVQDAINHLVELEYIGKTTRTNAETGARKSNLYELKECTPPAQDAQTPPAPTTNEQDLVLEQDKKEQPLLADRLTTTDAAPAPIAAAPKTVTEARTRVEPETNVSKQEKPSIEKTEPETNVSTPAASKLNTGDYLLKLNEIARNNSTRELTVQENTDAVKLGKQHTSKAIVSAWRDYLDTKPGRGFTLFARDVKDFSRYKPLKNTMDPEFKEALKHADEIRNAEIKPNLDAVFEKIGCRPGTNEIAVISRGPYPKTQPAEAIA